MLTSPAGEMHNKFYIEDYLVGKLVSLFTVKNKFPDSNVSRQSGKPGFGIRIS